MATKQKKKKNALPQESVIPEKTWSEQENDTLISRMCANLSSPDNVKYGLSLEKMHWDDVAFDSYSADDCKTRWGTIAKKIRKFRTLSELLEDAKEYVKDPYKGQYKKHPDCPKRPLTPYFRFYVENRDSYSRKHANLNNLEITSQLSILYKTLSDSQKEKYTEEWKEKSAVYKVAMVKFKNEHPDYFKILQKDPKEPRQPVTIYKDEKLEEFTKSHSEMSSKECIEALKAEFRSLPDEQRLNYITKALKEEEQYEETFSKNVEKKPVGAKKKKSNKAVLTKQERILNDKLHGKPKNPPSNGYNLFCTETMATLTHLSSQKRIVECGRLWKLKGDEEKKQYHDRYLNLKEQYEENYKDFFEKLSPEQKQKEAELQEVKPKSNKRRNPVPTVATLKKAKIEDKATSSSSDGDDDSSDDDTDDVAVGDSSDSGDGESDSDDEEESGEDEGEKEKIEEDEKFRRLVPARPTTPISALFLYQKTHRKKVESQYPGMSSDEVTRLLARRYHELPEHKRHKYVQKEKEQRALYNNKMQQYIKEGIKKNGLEASKKLEQPQPVTGEQIYHEKHLKQFLVKHNNDRTEADKALRTSWHKMNKTRRETFIVTAQGENEKNIAAYQKASKEAGIENAPPIVTIPTPVSKSKKKKFENEPKKPPASGYQLFSSTHMPSLIHLSANEKFKELGRLWTNLTPEKKEPFNKEAKRRNEKYKKELASWLKHLPPDVAAQYEEAKKAKKRGGKSNSGEKTTKKPKMIGTLIKVEEERVIPKADAEESTDSDSDSSSSEESEDESSSDEDSSSSSSASSSSESSDDSSSSESE